MKVKLELFEEDAIELLELLKVERSRNYLLRVKNHLLNILTPAFFNRPKFPRKHPYTGVIDKGPECYEKECPNCRKNTYMSAGSIEYCIGCGLSCDYWTGAGANEVYKKMMERNWKEQERLEELKRLNSDFDDE